MSCQKKKKVSCLYINSRIQVTIPVPLKNILFAGTPLSLRIPQLRGNTGLDDPCFVQRGLFLLPFLAFNFFFMVPRFVVLRCARARVLTVALCCLFSLFVCEGFIKLCSVGRYILMQPACMLWTHACCLFLMRNLFLHSQFRGVSVISVSQSFLGLTCYRHGAPL